MDTTNPTIPARPRLDLTREVDLTAASPRDPRPIFLAAVSIAGCAVDAVRPDQLDGPTPCDDFDVRGLLGHLVGALRRVAVVGRGLNVLDHPAATPGVPDDGWPAVWHATAADVEGVWAADALLDLTVDLPWATLSGAELLASYTGELTLHTWDLATATGQRVTWDPRVVSLALGSIRRALPAEGRAARYDAVRASQPAGSPPMSDPFGEAVEVSAYASLIDQLVAWSGRRP